MPTNVPSLPKQSITEQIYKKNVELLEERRRSEQLLSSVSEIVFAVDTNLNITLFNETAEKYFNLPEDAVLSKNADEIIKLKTDKGVTIRAEEYCFQGNPLKAFMSAVLLETFHGDIYVNVKTSVVVRDESQSECVVTMVDITKEKQMDKMKDEFISITSHELRTPITIIKSYLWMLSSGRGGTLTDKQKEYLNKAVSGSERMLALINDTLNVARIEQGRITLKIEEIKLSDFLVEFDDDFKIKTEEKGLYLRPDVAQDLWPIYADREKLREVFVNFLGNSAKFTDSGGITIKARNADTGFVKIEITDTGKGIKKEDLGRLFNKFGRLDTNFSTIAEVGGTGLGLYITKSLVEKMGGKVGVTSEGLGKGSTFWFMIPAEDPNSKICTLIQT